MSLRRRAERKIEDKKDQVALARTEALARKVAFEAYKRVHTLLAILSYIDCTNNAKLHIYNTYLLALLFHSFI